MIKKGMELGELTMRETCYRSVLSHPFSKRADHRRAAIAQDAAVCRKQQQLQQAAAAAATTNKQQQQQQQHTYNKQQQQQQHTYNKQQQQQLARAAGEGDDEEDATGVVIM